MQNLHIASAVDVSAMELDVVVARHVDAIWAQLCALQSAVHERALSATRR
jgi:hypothetical protein